MQALLPLFVSTESRVGSNTFRGEKTFSAVLPVVEMCPNPTAAGTDLACCLCPCRKLCPW